MVFPLKKEGLLRSGVGTAHLIRHARQRMTGLVGFALFRFMLHGNITCLIARRTGRLLAGGDWARRVYAFRLSH
jgi:hypothetical protein